MCDLASEQKAKEIRELILEYGSSLTSEEYEILYGFGLWAADKYDATEVILSDWTPH